VSHPIVLAAHGTADARGRLDVAGLADAVAVRLPHVDVRLGHVDVCGPTLDEALAAGADAPWGGVVVVPLFLAAGHHVRTDVPASVARWGGSAVVTPALGGAPELDAALAAAVTAHPAHPPGQGAGGRVDGAVVVSAGSADARARAEVADLAARLGELTGVPVAPAYLTGPGPGVGEAAEVVRTAGATEVLALSLLLASGHFLRRAHDEARTHGLLGPTRPLAASPHMTDLVVRRYAEA
jgi:sirohydrochlorin ferrochelatase